MTRLTHHLQIFLCLTCSGCTAGTISWADGSDDLRTALYLHEPSTERAQATVFLSTGLFDCDFPSYDDPQEQTEAIAALTTGACREDARHLILSLYAADTVAPGAYTLEVGEFVPQGGDLGAAAFYVGIEEAQAQLTDGLIPVYEPTEVTQYRSEQAPGEVRLRRVREGALSGRFDLPEVDVGGRFEAQLCGPDSRLFELLTTAPAASCALAIQ